MKAKSFKNVMLGVSATVLSGTMILSAVLPTWRVSEVATNAESSSAGQVLDVTGSVDVNLKQYLEPSVTQKLPATVSSDEEISVILSLDTETMIETYDKIGNPDLTIGEFAASKTGKEVSKRIERESLLLQNRLRNAGISFTLGNSYDTLFGGFEVLIQASAFDTLCKEMSGLATVMVGEVYEECETELVTNEVNVDENTGIFDSTDSQYDGTGTVIAVLDTGLDYTHSAFDVSGFTAPASEDVITMNSLRGVVDRLAAARTSPGLSAASVYYSRKVPYTYDYADGDTDVYPINSEHGTHVAGVMVGKDETIRGVAPNAQLAVMKVFSESQDGARQSWLLAALEDCVTLGVDVINMSLGTSVGFSREVDEAARQAIYDAIKDRGISLVAAASNDYNATFGSDKNGNLGLTSNPDSGTVGSPSTYEAALSVASIKGTKTPYMLYGDTMIYFIEASDRASEPKNFVEEILDESENSKTFTFVKVPGVGRRTDYASIEGRVAGKIALIKRGQTNFEEKARIAFEQGAVGVIIYNNVSGDISMTVGAVKGPVCSISKDDGEMLLRSGDEGQITVSRTQVAGPFMSDFSSWGPSPDLGIKPEITAHGGDILSAVPGQRYDRLSGTSMASPNQAGVTALVRQYVKDTFGLEGDDSATRREITAIVNQLMMSTADIARNTNGLPFSVRKQGAGLTNLGKATSTPAYLRSYDRAGEKIIDKAKIELGDDPDRLGVYSFRFDIVNISDNTLSYDLDAIVMTEGVSTELTVKGARTVTEKGYTLDGADVTVTDVASGSHDGNLVTVGGKETATVSVTITLSESDKEYLDRWFANGMYVEGYVRLTPKGEGVSLSMPYLAFYGSWSEAPLFDIDYFETSKDELDDSKDILEKTLPDAYATRPLGGLYGDYITYLGSYAYIQDPASTNKIAADREHIALTNQIGTDDSDDGGVNSIYSIYCGMLRAAKRMVLTITDTTTGEVIFERTQYNQRKSYNVGGGIGPSNFEVDFNARDYDLKNNTKYLVKLQGFIDYGEGEVANDTFEFPFYTDFTAPVVTGVEYSYEYDEDARKNRLYADISVYDNHYVQGYIPGYITESEPGSEYRYTLYGFGRYIQPVLGTRNSTNNIRIELTDYLRQIKEESYTHNSFMFQVMDYAMNGATYEITIPDDIRTISFEEEEIRISPNQTYQLNPTILPTQDSAWVETLNYTSSDESVVRVVGNKLVGVSSSPDPVTITATNNRNPNVKATVQVRVLAPGEPGYRPTDRPTVESFRLTGYQVNKGFYSLSNEENELGVGDDGDLPRIQFTGSYRISMYPSESVTLETDVQGYFDPSMYKLEYTSSNPLVVSVDANGTIVARNVDAAGNSLNSEREATIYVRLLMDDGTGNFTNAGAQTVSIKVKESYTTNGPYLTSYKGNGGRVVIPEEFGVTEIATYAFSNYRLVPKDLAAGDVIDEEDPYYSKQWYIGENTITEVVIPEGVETIQAYAFAGLTALEKVVLPSTLTKIQTGAFYLCTSLKTVEFSTENNLQFVNQSGFYGCSLLSNISFRSIIAFGDYAFAGSGLHVLDLPATAQSIGAGAFMNCQLLSGVTVGAESVKVGAGAFAGCSNLVAMEINASVVPEQLFDSCTSLRTVLLGKDVSEIGQFAFRDTGITSIVIDPSNPYLASMDSNRYVIDRESHELVFVAPNVTRFEPSDPLITSIGTGAFTAAVDITTVRLPNVTRVGDYAFMGCTALNSVRLNTLEYVGDNAFSFTAIKQIPALAAAVEIGDYAFAWSAVTSATISDGMTLGSYAFGFAESLTRADIGDGVTIGDHAFYGATSLASVDIGDNCTIGDYAFAGYSALDLNIVISTGQSIPAGSESYDLYADVYISPISSLTIGENAVIGSYAFLGAGSGEYGMSGGSRLGGVLSSVSLGDNAVIGDYAFYSCVELEEIDLSHARSIGAYAFSGTWTAFIIMDDEILVAGAFYVTPFFADLDLSSAVFVGEGAFEHMSGSEAVDGERVTLPSSVTFGDSLEEIGERAFYGNDGLTAVDLSGVKKIGKEAFADNPSLTTVTLSPDIEIGESAFENSTNLTYVRGLSAVKQIGKRAFAYTALRHADLTSAVTIGDYAFLGSALTSVTFGDSLEEIGENPFALCNLPRFNAISVGGSVPASSFRIGDKGIEVLNGVLYKSVPYGKVLVCYPLGMGESSYTVEEGTVRIGAYAFAGSDIASVDLPRSLAAIGDRAFYLCGKLSAVIFRSIEAPILEEAYDYEYDDEMDDDGIPYYIRDSVGVVQLSLVDGSTQLSGLGIVPYISWAYSPSNVLYGANFIDRIGTAEGRAVHANRTLIMSRPSNGNGYGNWLYEQYFDVTIVGVATPEEATVRLINEIDALPDNIDLDLTHEPIVADLEARYAALIPEQQALVTNHGRLEQARSAIEAYKQNLNPGDHDGGGNEPEPEKGCGGVIGGGAMLTAILTLAGCAVLLKKKNHE